VSWPFWISSVPSSYQRKLKMLDKKQSFGIEISDEDIFQLVKSILTFLSFVTPKHFESMLNSVINQTVGMFLHICFKNRILLILVVYD